ncbi:MAG: two-component system response regulator [Proteobacteria bacterium]|nr:MAG: two-component system response regulator [Pseudomonadota bacterium]PIE18201.1 MAG: two-component system response regulator [Pseudomonadota bacterium]
MSERRRLVYVEDNHDNFLLTKRVLEVSGNYEVHGAADGERGLSLVRALSPALVLLDLDVPKLSGFEIAAALRRDPATASIPLVAVSASVMTREKQLAIHSGCDAFVEKPIDIVALRELVDELALA